MAKKKYPFGKTSCAWIEDLYNQHYNVSSCVVESIVRARSQGGEWKEVTMGSSMDETAINLYNEGASEVRIAIKVPTGYNYMTCIIKELEEGYQPPATRTISIETTI